MILDLSKLSRAELLFALTRHAVSILNQELKDEHEICLSGARDMDADIGFMVRHTAASVANFATTDLKLIDSSRLQGKVMAALNKANDSQSFKSIVLDENIEVELNVSLRYMNAVDTKGFDQLYGEVAFHKAIAPLLLEKRQSSVTTPITITPTKANLPPLNTRRSSILGYMFSTPFKRADSPLSPISPNSGSTTLSTPGTSATTGTSDSAPIVGLAKLTY